MKNSIIKYDNYTDTSNNYINDYTLRNYKEISKLPQVFDNDFIYDYVLTNGEKLEELALRKYNSASYWDLILIINDLDPLFDTIMDYDNIANQAQYNIDAYIGTIQQQISELHYQYMIDEEVKRLENSNENKRTIKLIKGDKLQEFMKILRDLDYIK